MGKAFPFKGGHKEIERAVFQNLEIEPDVHRRGHHDDVRQFSPRAGKGNYVRPCPVAQSGIRENHCGDVRTSHYRPNLLARANGPSSNRHPSERRLQPWERPGLR